VCWTISITDYFAPVLQCVATPVQSFVFSDMGWLDFLFWAMKVRFPVLDDKYDMAWQSVLDKS